MSRLSVLGRPNLRDLIGALEIGDRPAAIDDGALESSSADRRLGPTAQLACTYGGVSCRHDGALESSSAAMSPTQVSCLPLPTMRTTGCRADRMDALEFAAVGPQPIPTITIGTGCRGTEDVALEASAGTTRQPTTPAGGYCTFNRPCSGVDDGTLEVSAAAALSPTSVNCLPIPTARNTGCRIDDGVLEGTAKPSDSTPMSKHFGWCTADGALETMALHAAPMPTATMLPPCVYRIDDGALEAAALMTVGPTDNCGPTRFPICRPRIDEEVAAERGVSGR